MCAKFDQNLRGSRISVVDFIWNDPYLWLAILMPGGHHQLTTPYNSTQLSLVFSWWYPRSLRLATKDWPPPVKTYDGQFYKIQKTNWNAIQLVMSPYLRLISWWCLQGLQLNCCVLTRRKNGPIETALSGHASAVLRVILTKETVCVAWLLYILSALAASRRLTKTQERNSDKHLPNFHAVPVLCP